MKETIEPHGGKLINRIADPSRKDSLLEEISGMESLVIDERALTDVEGISTGIFSPLEGFLCEDDYLSVLKEMRLSDGTPWSIPITLSVADREKKRIEEGENIVLKTSSGKNAAVVHLKQIFRRDKEREAQCIFGTKDKDHPGVKILFEEGNYLLGGKITVLDDSVFGNSFGDYHYQPAETRKEFKRRGWRRIVAFQTRNPIHRAHEYLQKCALEIVDGLMIHPIVGETKSGDISSAIRLKSYEEILDKYYPADRTFMSVFPASMHYAGPREAIFHALCRKNYGCTHFIVGRDHAGVGDYYGTCEAQEIFDEFEDGELGITPLFFDYAFYCESCGNMATAKTCPHGESSRIFLSGTEVRRRLRNGENIPPEMTRPEVSSLLAEAMGS